MRQRILMAAAVALCAYGAIAQQALTLPPSGGNQRQTIIQQIGPVKVTVDYSSPHVHSPQGQDRRGKIWGDLVPYGLVNLGVTCKECPWRAGANENTTFTTTDDIVVEGQKLAAGTYGLHMIPAKDDDWTVIFSKNFTSWGSFTYDPAEDALRVKVKPVKSDYKEVLTYDFTERRNDKATLALEWEELAVPIAISVPNASDLYVAQISKQLRNSAGFTWQNWANAAQYALQSKHNTEALQWATVAAKSPAYGQENFTTLMLLADAQDANGKTAEAAASREKALVHRTAAPVDIHQYARQLLTRGKKDEAIKMFDANAKRFPNEWPVNVGLARSYSAQGKYDEALKYAKLALTQAPDDLNKQSLQGAIKKLEAKQDIN